MSIHFNTFINERTKMIFHKPISSLYLIEMPFITFEKGVDPDQAALVKGYTLFANRYMIRCHPTLMDLTSNFFALFSNVEVYPYKYS